MLTGILLNGCNVHKGNYADLPISPNAKMKEINWSDVKWTEGLWAEKFDLCRREIIPAVFNGLMSPGNSEHQVVYSEDSAGWNDLLYRKLIPQNNNIPETGSLDITLIPYYAWANRGPAYMTVWIPLAR